jgi:hypothetical protein
MNRTARTFILFSLSAFAALAQPSQTVSTVGPIELYESQALIHTQFNPHEYTISKQVSWVDADSGQIIDLRELTLLPGRGKSVVYQQGRIGLDADLNEMPDTCRTTRTVVVMESQDSEVEPISSIVRAYDKSHRLSRGQRASGRNILWGDYFPPQGSPRAVSRPFDVKAASDITVRLMNVGSIGGAFTIELLDAIHGTVVAAKTVYLDPGPSQQKATQNAFAAFVFSIEAGVYVARIPAHTPEWSHPSAGDPGATKATPHIAISLQIQDNTSATDIAIEELHLVHEGFDLD